MAIKRHNSDYAAGPTFPEAVGDRYYAQDMFRDIHFSLDDAGQKVASGFTTFPVLLKDSNMTKGTNWDDLDIPIAKGIVEYEVDVPNSYASLPPTVTQENIYVRIETSAETDFDISGATLDGVTVNYVKVTYNETNGSSRTRAKKAGSYVYEKAVSYTITVSSAAPTNKDLTLGTVVGDGATFLTIVSYPRTRKYGDEYDYTVSTQDEFDIIIDRTAANQYKIKDNIKSIYVKFLSGGYQMTGATSPLQGLDAYGYIETNDCTRIVFEPGAFIDMHQNIGYIVINTDYCYLDSISIQGDKGAASGILQSFLLGASYVTFQNCNSQNRLSNASCTAFRGSGTAIHNQTVNVNNCKIINFDGTSTVIGFSDLYNVNNCTIYDVETTGNLTGFYQITNLNNCNLIQFDAQGTLKGLDSCVNCNNIYMDDFDTPAGGGTSIFGISACEKCDNITMIDFDGHAVSVIDSSSNITNISINDIAASNTTCYGISNTNRIENIDIIQLDAVGNCYAYNTCTQLSNCYAEDIDSSGGNAYGYYDSDYISSSIAKTCDDGFNTCTYFVGCNSTLNSNNGFTSCNNGSTNIATGNTNHGFSGCNRLSSSFASTSGVDGWNNCDSIVGSRAQNNTGDGFQDCNHIEHNTSTGNGAAAYNNSFADLAATRAAANTDSGGDNA